MPLQPTAGSFEVRLPAGGKTVVVSVIISGRCRRLTLKIKNSGETCVVMPARTGGDIIHKAQMFTLKNLDWLDRQLEKIENSTDKNSPITLMQYLREHPHIFVGNEPKTVEITSAPMRPFFVFRKDADVIPICVREESAEADLMSVVRKIAEQILPSRVSELATICGVSVADISVRNQHSRWGSCTMSGNLSFNWRLILLPPEIRDHVICHELAHRRHMNHSDDFWDMLYSWDPKTAEHDRELTKVWGKILMRF